MKTVISTYIDHFMTEKSFRFKMIVLSAEKDRFVDIDRLMTENDHFADIDQHMTEKDRFE
jgi:hypothetical protein